MAKKKKKSSAASASASAPAPASASASAEPPNAEAEKLRLAGNDAFMTEDWERAASLYRESLSIDPASKNSAKVYSNLAQTYVKLGLYQEAAEAAELAVGGHRLVAVGAGAAPELQRAGLREAVVDVVEGRHVDVPLRLPEAAALGEGHVLVAALGQVGRLELLPDIGTLVRREVGLGVDAVLEFVDGRPVGDEEDRLLQVALSIALGIVAEELGL